MALPTFRLPTPAASISSVAPRRMAFERRRSFFDAFFAFRELIHDAVVASERAEAAGGAWCANSFPFSPAEKNRRASSMAKIISLAKNERSIIAQ